MNRTRSSAVPQLGSAVPDFELEAGRFHAPHDMAHALFAPLHYEPRYPYPLIVWLHGPGADERNLMRIMPLVSMRNYVAVAPRGTSAAASDGRPSGYTWLQSDDHVAQAEQRVFDCIALARYKLHIAPHRVFLAGFDCGGTMALRIALAHPEDFAGTVSLGGLFPTGQTALRSLPAARRVPIFLAAGRGSLDYPVDVVCRDLRLLHTAGILTTLRQYPGGHQLAPQMLSDLDRWIIEQITSGGNAPVASAPSCQPE